jgi:hypothetical protein
MIRPRLMIRRGCSLMLARAIVLVFVLVLASSLTSDAFVQQNASEAKSGAAAVAVPRQPTPAPSPAAVPLKPAVQPVAPVSADQALYLVRSTLLTLNDANRSGNYTVLRDLAAPAFQSRNSAADLAQSFADLRRRNFDLFAAALIAPQFTAAPALDANGRVHLTGAFPTRPLQISFDMTFESVGRQWRLFAISVTTPTTGN